MSPNPPGFASHAAPISSTVEAVLMSAWAACWRVCLGFKRRGYSGMSVQSRPIDARIEARQAVVYDSDKFRVPFFYEARELFKYRFLVRNLIGRDLKVRYKRS